MSGAVISTARGELVLGREYARCVDKYCELYKQYLGEWRVTAGGISGVGRRSGCCSTGCGHPQPPVWVGCGFGVGPGSWEDSVGLESGYSIEGGGPSCDLRRNAIGGSDDSRVSVASAHDGVDAFRKDCDGPSNVDDVSEGLPALSGTDGGLGRRGVNWARNQQWKRDKKLRKQRKKGMASADWRRHGSGSLAVGVELGGSPSGAPSTASTVPVAGGVVEQGFVEDGELRRSSRDKWVAENKLAEERAKRRLAVLLASDVDAEVRRYRTGVSAVTERNMVSIEKTHGLLRATGNVPGSAETIVDSVPGLSSGSISPDSSASQAEFRALQKELLDLKKHDEDLGAALRKLGYSPENIGLYDKEVWTNSPSNDERLADMYPGGVVRDYDYQPDGKCRIIPMPFEGDY